MSTGSTPSLGLLLGDDALENENWQKLDRVYRALFREIIPDSVVIQGDLEVTGNTKLDGTLEVVGPATFDSSAQVANNLTVGGTLIVDGPMLLPPASIAGGVLAPGASIYTAQTGIAQTGQLGITTTLQDLGEIILSPPDDPARWELVICSMQFQVGMSGDNTGGISTVLQINLKRGQSTTIVVQSRQGGYTMSRAGYVDIPITMVRVTKPPVSDVARWAVEAQVLMPPGALLVTRDFTQLSVIQFT